MVRMVKQDGRIPLVRSLIRKAGISSRDLAFFQKEDGFFIIASSKSKVGTKIGRLKIGLFDFIKVPLTYGIVPYSYLQIELGEACLCLHQIDAHPNIRCASL